MEIPAWSIDAMPAEALRSIVEEYQLSVEHGESPQLVGQQRMAKERIIRATMDIFFARTFPTYVREQPAMVCAQLDTFQPQNKSEQRLLDAATWLSDPNPDHAGGVLIVCGKTATTHNRIAHVRTGLLKIVLAQDLLNHTRTLGYYRSPDDQQIGLQPLTAEAIMQHKSFMVIDSLHIAKPKHIHPMALGLIRGLLIAIAERGEGKLMLTANAPNAKIFTEHTLLPEKIAERQQFARTVWPLVSRHLQVVTVSNKA